MGYAKSELLRKDDVDAIAEAIAVECGALRRCMIHEDTVFTTYDDVALETAYRTAAWQYRRWKGEDPRFAAVESQAELTDAIKHVVESAGDNCAQCSNNFDRD